MAALVKDAGHSNGEPRKHTKGVLYDSPVICSPVVYLCLQPLMMTRLRSAAVIQRITYWIVLSHILSTLRFVVMKAEERMEGSRKEVEHPPLSHDPRAVNIL